MVLLLVLPLGSKQINSPHRYFKNVSVKLLGPPLLFFLLGELIA